MNESRPTYAVGDLVQFSYKTGVYAGRITEPGSPKYVVEVHAVLRHPDQGDLHNPYNPDVPMFHERRALAHREKALVLARDIQSYRGGELPEYADSLSRAVQAALDEADRLERWAARARENLQQLAGEYSPK